MFKLVVLCAFLASAAAKPGLLAPLAYSSTLVSPATTSISSHSSSVIHPAPYTPYVYSAPAVGYTHFIKKRSAPLAYPLATSYIAPTTYNTAPLISTYSSPYLHGSPLYASPYAYAHAPAYTHFIKKRSVALAGLPLASTYIAPTTYAASHLYQPAAYAAAPVIAHAPSSYSTQSRIDIKQTPLITTSHLSYPAPFAYSHLY